MENQFIPDDFIRNKIYYIRGHKTMLASDLAELYNIETRVLNQSVNRNLKRFPPDFMFQLSENEYSSLTSQIVMSKKGSGGRRVLLEIKKIKSKVNSQDKNMEIVFRYLDELIDKKSEPLQRRKTGFKPDKI
ncbi:ORF6N domain-containing protein [Mucilaginibacter sp. OK268]|uniref:ORF6N domain-containing protein n=1 Tax=Mucilaginibacter sp. OK268 TaxID=1881048 RepID=UPI00087FFEBE|nr:ORF6N domain-containing protein [Mucilaginibacter sp. OK268]SDP10614.1 ORF6N domain-containing protein [Mucilaginibacter sp. OK268]